MKFLRKPLKKIINVVSKRLNLRNSVYVGDNRVLTHLFTSSKIFVDSKDISISPHIILDGIWEPEVTNFILKIIHPGMNVVEAGANIGYYTILMAHAVGPQGHIFAFEPDPRVYEFLRDNIEINGLRDRVTLFNIAASNKRGVATFYQFDKHRASGSLFDQSEDYLPEEKRKSFDVQLVDIDSKLNDIGFKKNIDLIKIDAEGSELYVLDGAKKNITENKNIKVICEFNKSILNSSGIADEQFFSELAKLGFSYRAVQESGLVAIGDMTINTKSVFDIFLEKK